MNMFKRGRKAKDQPDPFDTLISAGGTKTTKISWRRGKHAVVDDKPALDLENALPDSDGFRTSLIMPGLSARFSMLREQDDPHSKIGKASDDSVLFPKRASRLNLFGHHAFALTDIAEVESIRSSIKPPFAQRERAGSFGDGYDSDGGSVMARSRPGEGNNLFGGRQKLYRIPTGSTRTLADGAAAGMGGRHMYESDVSLSHFQQHRLREREAHRSDEDRRTSADDDQDARQSPTLGHGFSQKRGTQSSTASARSNMRSSTAATSVTSDSPAHLAGGVAATATATATATSTEAPGKASPTLRKRREDPVHPARQLSPSKSAANIRDKYRPAGIYSASALRGPSPASAGVVPPLDFGFGDAKAGTQAPSPAPRRTASPVQPGAVETQAVLAGSVRAHDRGKATALGLFNKPAREFDEQQYLQRQLQMHEGRSSPFPAGSRSQSRASSEARRGSRPDPALRATPSPALSDTTYTAYNASLPPIPGERAAKTSTASTGRQTPPTRPRSKSSGSSTSKDEVPATVKVNAKDSAHEDAKDSAKGTVKARVESLIRRQNAELALLESQNLGSGTTRESTDSSGGHQVIGGTFLDDDDTSSLGDARPPMVRQSTTDSLRLPDGDIHPAFRSSFATSTASSQYSLTRSPIEDHRDEGEALDLPAGVGLSGLIRSHLRHDSERSVGVATGPSSARLDDPASTSLLPPGRLTPDPPTPTTAMSQRAQQMLSRAMALKAAAGNTSPSTPADDASDYGDDDENQDARSAHQRGDSSATTKERREFDEELAERRRRIREGLKSVVETERSAGSTTPRGREHTLQAFAQPDDGVVPGSQPPGRDDGRAEPKGARTGSAPDVDVHARDLAFGSTKPRSSPEQRAVRTGTTTPSQQRHHRPVEWHEYGPRRDGASPTSDYAGRSRSNSSAADRSRYHLAYRGEPSPSLPAPYSPTGPRSPAYDHGGSGSPFGTRGRSGSTMGARGPLISPTHRPDVELSLPRPSPAPLGGHHLDGHPVSRPPSANGRTTPNRNTHSSSQSGRKRSGTKTQISGPTFISSTSSVPLVPLPQNTGSQEPPPLPEMNPRRRGNTGGERQHPTLNLNLSNSLRLPLETVPASPRLPEHDDRPSLDETTGRRIRHKLRKSSSEGGNLASTARQQAILAEFHREKALASQGPMFPNRSTTALNLGQEGGMF